MKESKQKSILANAKMLTVFTICNTVHLLLIIVIQAAPLSNDSG